MPYWLLQLLRIYTSPRAYLLHGQNISPGRLSDCLLIVLLFFFLNLMCAHAIPSLYTWSLNTYTTKSAPQNGDHPNSNSERASDSFRFVSFCFVCKNSIEYVCHVEVLLFLRLSFSLSIFRFHSPSKYTALLLQTAIIVIILPFFNEIFLPATRKKFANKYFT